MIRDIAAVTTKHQRINRRGALNALTASVIGVLSFLVLSSGAIAQTISLGAAQDFTIVSAAGVTNVGSTVITGNIALSPNISITGFGLGEGVVTGTVHSNDDLAIQARTDAFAAYTTLATLTKTIDESGVALGGLTLTPGIYYFATSADLTGILTLDTQGDPNALFVFQIGSTLTTAVGSSVVVTGAGSGTDTNIYWQVGTSATIGSETDFEGNILALDSVSLGTGADVLYGRTMALNGAVTLLSNNISMVPEPETWAMLFFGMGVLGLWNWQRVRRHAFSLGVSKH